MKKLNTTWKQQKCGQSSDCPGPVKAASIQGRVADSAMASDNGLGRRRFLGRIPINGPGLVLYHVI